MRIERYTAERKTAWDSFVFGSKNGTFLFLRDYMDYHADRFKDNSLMVYEGDKLIALLPAHRMGNTLSSHSGLTYGGFITDSTMKLHRMIDTFYSVLQYAQSEGITEILYKTIPHIYHKIPAEEDRYALFLCGAEVTRCGTMTALGQDRPAMQERRVRGIRRAEDAGLRVGTMREQSFSEFWKILTERLEKAHGAKPVHTLREIRALADRFPNNIKLYGAYDDVGMLAGVVVYQSDDVTRLQYIAASDDGLRCGALDLLISSIANAAKTLWIDFGTSDEASGINQGLLDQKEGFGARMVAHYHYRIDVARAMSRLRRKPTVHIVTPFLRSQNIPKLVEYYQNEGVIWHPICDKQENFPDLWWIQPAVITCPVDWYQPSYKSQWFIDHVPIEDNDYYQFMCDDDLAERGFYDKVQGRTDDVIMVSLQRGYNAQQNALTGIGHESSTLVASPESRGRGKASGQQCIMKGRVFKTVRMANTGWCDGIMVEYLVRNYKIHYEPEWYVYFNYLEPGRWDKPKEQPAEKPTEKLEEQPRQDKAIQAKPVRAWRTS